MTNIKDYILTTKIWSFDIDGVLTDYPMLWLKYLNKKTGTHYLNKQEAKKLLGEEYFAIKHEYRKSDYKFQVPILPDTVNFISELRKSGNKIIFASSRPFKFYSDMKLRTENWLKSNHIYFDALFSKEDLSEGNFDIHVDDELNDIIEIKSRIKSKKYILYARNSNNPNFTRDNLNNVKVVSSFSNLI